MKNVKRIVEIPEGCFFWDTEKDCTTCRYGEVNNRNSYNEVYCSYYERYYYPADRRGCGGFQWAN